MLPSLYADVRSILMAFIGIQRLLPDKVEGKDAYQRSSMDMYMFYNVMLQSWCMAQDLPDVADAGSADSGTLVDTSDYLVGLSLFWGFFLLLFSIFVFSPLFFFLGCNSAH